MTDANASTTESQPTPEPELGLIGLEVRNFQMVKWFAMGFQKGQLVTIGGDNAQGKTGICLAFQALMGGRRALPDEAIRRGQKAGYIEGDLGRYKARLDLSQGAGPRLTLRDNDGKLITAPQRVLDSICGLIGYNPLKFQEMDRKGQAIVLMDLVGLDVAGIDAKYKKAFADRASVGKDVKVHTGALASLPFDAEAPKEVKPITELLAERGVLVQKQQGRDAAIKGKERLTTNAEGCVSLAGDTSSKIEALKVQIRELQVQIEQQKSATVSAFDKASAIEIPDEISTDEIDERIANAEETNNIVRANQAHLKTKARLEEANSSYRGFTTALSALQAKKAQMLADATFPVEGLGLDDDNLPTYNGFALDACSSAEKLLVSASIGLAANPELKVLVIDDGEKLDKNNRAALAQFAKDNDAVILMACVDHGENCTVAMVDGEAVETDK